MLPEGFFELGYIARTHGLKGEVVIKLDCDEPEAYYNLESVFLLQNGNPVPFFINRLSGNGLELRASIEGNENVDQAKALVGQKLLLPLDILPKKKEGYYFHELVGLLVKDSQQGQIGKVISYLDQTAQPLIDVDHNGKSLLIPLIDEIVTKVDIEKKEIRVTLPDGYISSFTDHEN